MIRGFRYRLSPTQEQEALLRQFSGVCRLIYNLALEQRRDFWRQYQRANGRVISFPSQSRELTELRSEFDWIADVTRTPQEQALRDLDMAFANFFSGRAKFPKSRRCGENDSFRFQGRSVFIRPLNGKWALVFVPKIGWIKFRRSRPISGQIRNATISRDALGWHISFACRIEHEAPTSILPAVGIDRGVANTLALSTGEMMSLPVSLGTIERRLRSAKRVLSRRRRGSKRRARQQRRCAALSARMARIRRDWHHKAALSIACRFGTVVLEDLKITNMTAAAHGKGVRAKAGLNRSILNQGWGSYERIQQYKLEERGGSLVKVNPAYTSQECSACGHIDPRNRKSQAEFECVGCGHTMHADHNAPINILRRNTALMRVEGGRWAPDEARTGGVQSHSENPLASAGGRC